MINDDQAHAWTMKLYTKSNVSVKPTSVNSC